TPSTNVDRTTQPPARGQAPRVGGCRPRQALFQRRDRGTVRRPVLGGDRVEPDARRRPVRGGAGTAALHVAQSHGPVPCRGPAREPEVRAVAGAQHAHGHEDGPFLCERPADQPSAATSRRSPPRTGTPHLPLPDPAPARGAPHPTRDPLPWPW